MITLRRYEGEQQLSNTGRPILMRTDNIVYNGKFQQVREIEVHYDEGKMSKLEVVSSPSRKGIVCALVKDVIKEKWLFVKQFRPAVNDYMLEAPAGMIDGFETPEEAVIREVREEVGLVPDIVKSLPWFYSSPGAQTEKMYPFIIWGGHYAALPQDENENIEVIELDETALRDQSFRDAKTLALFHLYTEMQLNAGRLFRGRWI